MTDHSESNVRDDARTMSDAEATVSTPTSPSSRPSGGRTPGDQDSASAPVQPRTDLGSRCHIESALGEGGMGRVYKAYDRGLHRRVAIKVIRAGLVADPDAVWSSQFSGTQSDLFRLEDEIFEGVVKALGVARPGSGAASSKTTSTGAGDMLITLRLARGSDPAGD